MCIQAIKKRRKRKKEEREFQKMLSSIQRMYGVMMRRHYLDYHLRRASEKDVAQLISDNDTQEVERGHERYCIPPKDKFIKHSLEKRPDWVFHLDGLEIFDVGDWSKREPILHRDRLLPEELLSKDFYVFLYDSFGFPETHLCARRGYVLYDPERREIVAEAFDFLS